MEKKGISKKIIVIILIALIIIIAAVGIWYFTRPPAVTKITWWVGSWSEEAAKELASRFEKENPNIKVEVVGLPWAGMFDKILSALQTESPPDVVDVAVAWNQPLAALGLVVNLDPYAKELDLTDFYKAALDTATYKGSLYGIPFRIEVGALMWNKKLFKEAGLDPEKPPTTWDELYEYAKKLTIPGRTYAVSYGFGEKMHAVYEFVIFLWGNGGDILDSEYKKAVFNSPEGIEALSFLTKLYQEGLMPKEAVSLTRDDMFDSYFLTEKSAMHHAGLYHLPKIKEKNPELYKNIGIAPIYKQSKGHVQYVQIGGWNRVIAKNSKNQDAAWKFIKFLSMPENQAFYTHTFPAVKSGLKYKNFYGIDYSDPYVIAFSKVLDAGHLTPPIAQWSQVVEELSNAIVNALTGKKTPKQALDDAAARVNEILKG